MPATDLSVGGVVKHLARMENLFFTHKLLGHPLPAPWDSAPGASDPDWDFRTGQGERVEDLRRLYEQSCARSRAAVADLPPEHLSTLPCFGARIAWSRRGRGGTTSAMSGSSIDRSPRDSCRARACAAAPTRVERGRPCRSVDRMITVEAARHRVRGSA